MENVFSSWNVSVKDALLEKKCYSIIFVWSKLPPPLPPFFFTIRTAPALCTSRQYDNENVSPNDLSFLKLKPAPSLRGGGHHDISIQANFVHMNLWIHANSMWYVLEFPILSEIVSWSFYYHYVLETKDMANFHTYKDRYVASNKNYKKGSYISLKGKWSLYSK